MRIVIVGIGEIGLELAKNLAQREKNEIALIDIDEKRCEELATELDAFILHGDGSNPDILKKAQLTEADALVATTGSDPINTVIAMLGHLFKVEKIIVKLNTLGLRSACQEMGVSSVITPKVSAAAEIMSTLYGFDRVNFSSLVSGGLILEELEIGKAPGKRLSDLEMPDGGHIVAILREERVYIPKPDFKFQDGDALLLLIEDKDVIARVKEQLESSSS